ncbi:MAG: HIT family protein [Flavobacteriaceae bacterium]|nr:HIT family protein [Flavobacteriaceae bacterium]|tara:strand:- start:8341 stop:8739 length:399 start_codon:yes stop_codon:yes gene_type:complete
MSTIFSKIIDGEIPCYKVAENDDFLAFLDINPNSIGHTLCIPKREVDDILDLDETTYKNLMLFSRKVAKSIKQVVECKKVSISIIGLEVPHVHVHLIPINEMKDANFSNKVSLSLSDFKETARLISNSFNSL